jgi:hypothetical protein
VGLPFGHQGHSLRSYPADSLRSPLTAGPAALVLAGHRVRPSRGQSPERSFPVAETLSTAAAAVLTMVILSAPALPFRDGSKEHQREGGRVGRFVGPDVAGVGPHPEAGEIHDVDGPSAKRLTEAVASPGQPRVFSLRCGPRRGR